MEDKEYAQLDFDGDGAADTITATIVTFYDSDSFSSGDLSALPWTTSSTGSNVWGVSSYGYAITTPGHSETSKLELTTTSIAGDMSFYYYTQTESDSGCDSYDYFEFYIDGVKQFSDCGISTGWEYYSTTLSAGSHDFLFQFKRDSSWCSDGSGCGVTDFVALDAVSIPTSLSIGYASATPAGTPHDYDDDNDGYSDLDETTNCDTGAYASTSDTLDASSTPADMDSDLICDALDTDRDGDTYANSNDVFPDDVTEWIDTDLDGTGNNESDEIGRAHV